MEIRLLGPLQVRDGDEVVSLPRRQQRALLAALALRAGEVVSTDRLIADLWGESAPPSATGSLQNTVAALRKLIGRDVLITQAPGYRLAVPRDSVDVNRFEALVTAARDADPARRVELLRDALGLWRGPALADVGEEDFSRHDAGRLEELRVAAQEDLIDAELELGRHTALVGELEALVTTHPTRDRFRGQLMLALYRCGRQTEAFEVYRATRLALADELGLDPSPELQELHRRMLNQDPLLVPPTQVADDAPAREVAELRLVTVLAATPPLADDPERLRRLLDETLASVRDVLDRYGGSLQRFGPERLVAFFGADGPADDDAERAVLAARELGLSAGIATGEVVQGAGAVVTRADELARVGGIRLDERTAALVRAERRLDAPLAGREEELARLRAALAAAARKVVVASSPLSAIRGSARPVWPASWRCSRKRGRRCSSPAASPTARASPSCRCSKCFAGPSRSTRSRASWTPNWCSPGSPRSPKEQSRHRSASPTGPSAGCSRRSRGRDPSCSSSTTSTGPSRRWST